jgi:hypothetical protein
MAEEIINIYQLNDFEGESVQPQIISFYEKNQDNTTRNSGTTVEEMLRVSIARLQDLNARFACRENSIAITKIQEALLWLNERTRERKERGVEGTHQK